MSNVECCAFGVVDFETKKLEISLSFSEILRKSRESKNISLEEASEILGIQKKYLIYLEGGNFQNLPATVYTRNFILRYAEFLDLDPERVVNLYKEEFGLINNFSKVSSGEKKLFFGDLRLNPRLFGSIALFIILGLVLAYLVFKIYLVLTNPPQYL